ncbi:TolB family protein [Roseateles sp.]|uniref:TolB family protein n=1 Tax=Roseateles sp. TaxID=1971397 RepID=UPI0039ED7B54
MPLPAPTRRLVLQTLLCASAAPALAADAKPEVAIVLARLEVTTGQVSAVTRITHAKGASFQPSFTRDGGAVLYASDRSGSSNIYRYNIANGETTALTNTPHNLYSPTPLPDGSGFSAIRVVDADPNYGIESKQPSLWRFGWDGQAIAPVVPVMRVGYHAWLDEQRLALFIVDDVAQRNAHKAVLFNRATGTATPLSARPGRSLGRTPDGRRASFVDQTDPAHWRICAMGEDDAAPQVLVETPVGPEGEKDPNRSQYFAWLPDGSLLMARGQLLLRWDGQAGGGFQPLAELAGLGGSIRNITASPDGKRLAFSVLLAAAQP